MVRPTLQPWSAAALLLLLSSALLLSSPAHLVEGLQLPSQASLTGLRIRLQSAFASSPSSSPPSRVLGDAAQVDVPFDYSYFNTFLNSECSPAYVDAQGKPHKASTGFPGSCPRTIPWSDPKIAPAPPSVPSSSGSSSSPLNCSSTPEQVALKWWGTREGGPAVLISWVTCGGSYSMPPATPPATPPPAPPPLDTAAAPPSTLHVGAAPGVYDREVPAVSFSYTVDYSSRFDLSAWQPLSNPPPGPPPTVAAPSLAQEGGGTYISPVVHHALVRGLKPGEPVFYRIAGPPSSSSSPLSSAARSAASFSGQFKVPGGTFPLRVGVVGDPGQTFNTSTTFDFLLSGGGVGGGGKKPDVVLMPGDLTYADNSGDWNMYFNWAQAEAISENINPFSPRWDAFGRLVSPLAAAVPILTAPGNHEVEQTPDNALYPVQAGWRNDAFLTRFANYLARYPSPQTTQQVSFLFMRAPERERARERAQARARSRGRARGRAQRARERARACERRSPEARAHETFFFFKKKNSKQRHPKLQKALHGPSVADLAATTPSDPDQGRGLYYSTVLPGVATVVSLSTYTFTDSFSASDPMFQWLRRELAAVDRASTPWLIVQMHASFYSTSLLHSYEVECMRQAYEPLFREFGVDLVFSGHDHDYERSAPTYDYQVDPECGTVREVEEKERKRERERERERRRKVCLEICLTPPPLFKKKTIKKGLHRRRLQRRRGQLPLDRQVPAVPRRPEPPRILRALWAAQGADVRDADGGAQRGRLCLLAASVRRPAERAVGQQRLLHHEQGRRDGRELVPARREAARVQPLPPELVRGRLPRPAVADRGGLDLLLAVGADAEAQRRRGDHQGQPEVRRQRRRRRRRRGEGGGKGSRSGQRNAAAARIQHQRGGCRLRRGRRGPRAGRRGLPVCEEGDGQL